VIISVLGDLIHLFPVCKLLLKDPSNLYSNSIKFLSTPLLLIQPLAQWILELSFIYSDSVFHASTTLKRISKYIENQLEEEFIHDLQENTKSVIQQIWQSSEFLNICAQLLASFQYKISIKSYGFDVLSILNPLKNWIRFGHAVQMCKLFFKELLTLLVSHREYWPSCITIILAVFKIAGL